MNTQSDYELAAEDILNDKVKAIGFDEVLQCLHYDDVEFEMSLALSLFKYVEGQSVILNLITKRFLANVLEEGLIYAIQSISDEDNNLNKTYEALMNKHKTQQMLIERALVVYETEIENRLGV